MSSETRPRVKQLRLVVEAEDYEAAVAFYRDVLGLHEQAAFEGEGEGDARVMILDAGRATLEIANPAQVRMIDGVEADGHPSARLRVAFEVDDSVSATDELVAAGATLIASPRETPWRSLNSRLDAPAGLQVTLFQELDEQPPRDDAPDSDSPFEGHA
jgi:catechol 2,3-dioxygenase-like lactoylglutathione lyase family enzyme